VPFDHGRKIAGFKMTEGLSLLHGLNAKMFSCHTMAVGAFGDRVIWRIVVSRQALLEMAFLMI
jgi:hypothetical protein